MQGDAGVIHILQFIQERQGLPQKLLCQVESALRKSDLTEVHRRGSRIPAIPERVGKVAALAQQPCGVFIVTLHPTDKAESVQRLCNVRRASRLPKIDMTFLKQMACGL